MKKIFTLLFSTALLGTAFAQYGPKDQRDNGRDVYASNADRDNGRYDSDFRRGGRGTYVFTLREKNVQIEQIYREYNYKIQSVKSKPFMAGFQKKRLIDNLEAQRAAEICQVNDKFNSPRNLFVSYGRNDKKRW